MVLKEETLLKEEVVLKKQPDKNKGTGEEQTQSPPLKQPRRVAAALPAGPSRLDSVERNLAAA